MKLPARAFAEIYPQDVQPGQLFKFRGTWALRVVHLDDAHGVLMLSGERAGWVHKIAPGMSTVIALTSPFGWFPAVSTEDLPTVDAAVTATLMISAAGPAICGVREDRGSFDPEHLVFGPDGVAQDADGIHRTSRYEKWSAELVIEDRPFVSLGTLFEMDRATSAAR